MPDKFDDNEIPLADVPADVIARLKEILIEIAAENAGCSATDYLARPPRRDPKVRMQVTTDGKGGYSFTRIEGVN